jgi:hypothetical protein
VKFICEYSRIIKKPEYSHPNVQLTLGDETSTSGSLLCANDHEEHGDKFGRALLVDGTALQIE